MPEMKAEGTKTAHSVRAIEISAPPTSSIVRWAACKGDTPSRILRSTFSTTTIASSTTMPTASTRPNRDRLLSDMPKATRIVNVPTRETGIAMTGMIVARQDGHENRYDDLVDRLRDEDRRIVDDDGVDAGRKVLLQLLHGRHDFTIDRERVGAGLGIDEQGRRIAAIHVGRAAVIRGADLDPTDVADAGHASSVVGLDDDVGELLGRGQPAERFDVDLISFVTRGRRLVQDTGRDLKILRAQRGEHVAGGEIVGRRLVRVEPDAHRIFA